MGKGNPGMTAGRQSVDWSRMEDLGRVSGAARPVGAPDGEYVYSSIRKEGTELVTGTLKAQHMQIWEN